MVRSRWSLLINYAGLSINYYETKCCHSAYRQQQPVLHFFHDFYAKTHKRNYTLAVVSKLQGGLPLANFPPQAWSLHQESEIGVIQQACRQHQHSNGKIQDRPCHLLVPWICAMQGLCNFYLAPGWHPIDLQRPRPLCEISSWCPCHIFRQPKNGKCHIYIYLFTI